MSRALFNSALQLKNDQRAPVWLMRQAGRYHSHYQNLKKTHSFMDLCKVPELACETTLGPMRDFDFDAAILFSDLLFPLEVMGMGLDYVPGPKLQWYLKSKEDLKRLKSGKNLAVQLQFQPDAIRLIRQAMNRELRPDRGLIGFVGGPLTLFYYATEGSHRTADSQTLTDAKKGLNDGRYEGFVEILVPILAQNMAMQSRTGELDVLAVMDTCAGELTPGEFETYAKPALRLLFSMYREWGGVTPILYYTKGTGVDHWETMMDLDIRGIGVDWNTRMDDVLRQFGGRMAVQGNFDPSHLLLPTDAFEQKLAAFWDQIKSVPADLLRGWICGLGHGVLQHTPEAHVRRFVERAKEWI